MPIRKFDYKYYAFRFSGIFAFLILWEVLPRLNVLDNQFIPSLSQTLMALVSIAEGGELFTHIMVSIWRALAGLIFASAISVPLGVVLSRYYPNSLNLFNPFFRLLAQVNPFSLMPVFILFFGIGEDAKIAIVTWVCLWPILFHTTTGVKTVDPILVKTALSTGASEVSILRKVIFPASLHGIFEGIRIAVEMSFFMLIAAEMIGATAGLGALLHNSAMNTQIPRMYAASATIVLLGVLLNKILIYLQKRMFFWKEEQDIFGEPQQKEEVKPFTQESYIIIAVVLAAILFVGILQVQKAAYEENNPRNKHKQHTNMIHAD